MTKPLFAGLVDTPTDWTCQHTAAGSLANIWCQGQCLPSFNAGSALFIHSFIQSVSHSFSRQLGFMKQNPFVLYMDYWISELGKTTFRQDHPTLSLHTASAPVRGERDTRVRAHRYILGACCYISRVICIWEYVINNIHTVWEALCSVPSNSGTHHGSASMFLLLLRDFYEQKELLRSFF